MEPKIPKKQRKRAIHALRHAASLILVDTDGTDERPSCSCLCIKSSQKRRHADGIDEDTPSSKLTPAMHKAHNQGLSMIKSIVFPSLPAVLQDIWVYAELIVAILAFAIGMFDIFPVMSSFGFNYTYLSLLIITLLLALTDGIIYSFQHGSCARGIRACRKMLKKRRTNENRNYEQNGDHHQNSQVQNRCCQYSKKCDHFLNIWFELGRNILTELLLYPLLMCDMFKFITDSAYLPKNAVERTDFGLFIIGGFYLILAVYIMRVFMVAGSMVSLIRIPVCKASNGDRNGRLLITFCVHVLGQIIVHFMVILVIGAKISNENPQQSSLMNGMSQQQNQTLNSSIGSSKDDGLNASPFLITSMVLGGIIPLYGVLVFFVVNYYWMKEFSIGFWLNMVSLLQGENFAQAVFGGEGISSTKSKVQQFMEKSQYVKVKRQIKQLKAVPIWTKFFFPARIPLTAFSGLLYDILLLVFIACLMLTLENGSIKLVVFRGDNIMSTAFTISVTVILLANIHVLILLNFILATVVLVVVIAAAIALFLSPLLLLVYVPMVVFLSYFLLFYEVGTVVVKRYKLNLINKQLSIPIKTEDQCVESNLDTNTIQIDFRSSIESVKDELP